MSGCQNFGTGGTGELVVPRATLRQIDEVRIENLPTTQQSVLTPVSATRPSTQASTQPASQPSTQPAQMALSISDVRRLALQNNLDLKVEYFNPSIAKQDLSEEEAFFESTFFTNAQFQKLDQPTSSELEGSAVTAYNIQPGVTIPLRTGGNIQLSMPIDQLETNNEFSTLNPSWTVNPALSLTVPLLRGFGVDANAERIRVAFYQYQQSQARTKLQVIRVLADADRVYWRLYAARQDLIVRQREYDLAVAQLERAKRQAHAGVVAEVDVVRAESGVADRVEAIITAENNVRQRERELKRILNDPDLRIDSSTIVIPTSEPHAFAFNLDPVRIAQRALEHRMELLEIELQIATETANVAFAKNDMLPLVTLQYTYNLNGLGGAAGDAFDQVWEQNFTDNAVNLQVQIPIGNQAARSRMRRALLNRLQQLATREQRELQIRQEVYDAIDTLEANWQRYVAARQRVVLAARVLDVEIRQFNQGLRTSTDVLDAQTRLADARRAEIGALTEHQIAQVDIAFATGTLIGASQVDWEPVPAPRVP
ncbi:MAG: TolC family protein [Tepidisphaeraceae bacterium]